jgi:hypothetical protein
MTMSKASRAAMGIAGALVIAVIAVAPALATETTINFDSLTPGERVNTQYESQGLVFDYAESLAAPPFGAGDCGPPTVVNEGYSGPNSARLGICPAGDYPESGTVARFTKDPIGTLSLRATFRSEGEESLDVKTYGPAGTPLGNVETVLNPLGWTLISVSDPTLAPIGFLEIVSTGEDAEANESKYPMQIDDLTFGGPYNCAPPANYASCARGAITAARAVRSSAIHVLKGGYAADTAAVKEQAALDLKAASASKIAAAEQVTMQLLQAKSADKASSVSANAAAKVVYQQTKVTDPNATIVYKATLSSDTAMLKSANAAATVIAKQAMTQATAVLKAAVIVIKQNVSTGVLAAKSARNFGLQSADSSYESTLTAIKDQRPQK